MDVLLPPPLHNTSMDKVIGIVHHIVSLLNVCVRLVNVWRKMQLTGVCWLEGARLIHQVNENTSVWRDKAQGKRDAFNTAEGEEEAKQVHITVIMFDAPCTGWP